MNWLEVTVNTHSESVEVVSSILIELGSKGVSIDDPQDYYQLTDEQLEWLKVQQKDLYETDTVIVKGYFQPSQWTEEANNQLDEQLKELKIFYDADRYSAVKKILKTINDFMLKYLEDARTSSIAKINLSNERKKMEQETQFIAEEVRYFKEHSTIKYEINKIRDEFHQNLVSVVNQLYDFEESSYRIIEDIGKDIGYNENISIKKMMWELT